LPHSWLRAAIVLISDLPVWHIWCTAREMIQNVVHDYFWDLSWPLKTEFMHLPSLAFVLRTNRLLWQIIEGTSVRTSAMALVESEAAAMLSIEVVNFSTCVQLPTLPVSWDLLLR
jgi:hypothetical protein